MSDFVQSLVISGSIFAVMTTTQLGRRYYTWHKVVMPILSVSGFTVAYLRHAPTSAVDLEVYGIGIAIGAVFAVLATRATSIERDTTTGKLMTRCGAAFFLAWLVSVALDPAVQARLVAAATGASAATADVAATTSVASELPDGLSSREAEVLSLIAAGRSNKEIAGELFVSEATVKTHDNNIFAKAGLRDRARAVHFAFTRGLVGRTIH